jgi:hypothetical protein
MSEKSFSTVASVTTFSFGAGRFGQRVFMDDAWTGHLLQRCVCFDFANFETCF